MKKAVLLGLLSVALCAHAQQTMRVCEPTVAPQPTAQGLRDLGAPTNYSALCSGNGITCRDVERENYDPPQSHCFVISTKRGKLPEPSAVRDERASDSGPHFPQLVPVK